MLTFAAEVVALGETLERLTMSEQIKFCVDCAFCLPAKDQMADYGKLKFAKCMRRNKTPPNGYTFISPEHAEKEQLESANYCRVERESEFENLCGPSARFFQPKPPAPAPASEPSSEHKWPKAGDKMRFLGRNGFDNELARAKQQFVIGSEYEVDSCDVGDWSHTVYFVGIEGGWNGVMFELVRPDA